MNWIIGAPQMPPLDSVKRLEIYDPSRPPLLLSVRYLVGRGRQKTFTQ